LDNQVLSKDRYVKLTKLRNTKDHKEVSLVKLGDFKKYLTREALSIDIPGRQAKRILAKTSYFNFLSEKEFHWSGRFNNGDAIIVSKDGRTFGQIRFKNRLYKIEYLENDIAAFIEFDMSVLNQSKCATDESITKKASDNASSRLGNESQITSSLSSLTHPLVRVLVLFTPAAQNSGQNINDIVNLSLAQFLAAEVNSSVTVDLQLAGIQSFNFVETDRINGDVQRLRNDATAQQLRNQFEADIVVLLTNSNQYIDVAGIVAQVSPSEPDAYAIVQIANATSTLTFSHEVGHLFGCRHENTSDTTPGDAHGYGWQTGIWPFRSKYGTIMRRLEEGRTRIMYFSNPGINYDGSATGVTGESFNAKTLNFNGWVLQGFRYSTPLLVADIQGPGSANNDDVLTFDAMVYNGQNPYSYVWQANTGGGFYNVGYQNTLYMTMPTNTDLEISLTVNHGNNAYASDYSIVKNNFLGGGCTTCPDSIASDRLESIPRQSELELSSISVYPNPAFDKLTVLQKKLTKNSKFQILDNNGSPINELEPLLVENGENLITLDISQLKKGIYFLKAFEGNSFSTVRFIKK
jgi:hypothetical protein